MKNKLLLFVSIVLATTTWSQVNNKTINDSKFILPSGYTEASAEVIQSFRENNVDNESVQIFN